jgi:hypothetical protein
MVTPQIARLLSEGMYNLVKHDQVVIGTKKFAEIATHLEFRIIQYNHMFLYIMHLHPRTSSKIVYCPLGRIKVQPDNLTLL